MTAQDPDVGLDELFTTTGLFLFCWDCVKLANGRLHEGVGVGLGVGVGVGVGLGLGLGVGVGAGVGVAVGPGIGGVTTMSAVADDVSVTVDPPTNGQMIGERTEK